MKNKIINRKKYQDILYYVSGYFIINENLPCMREISEALGTTKQNISNYIAVLLREGYLQIIPNRTIRKYGINFNKMTILREHNVKRKFIEFGLIDDPLELEQ